MHALAWGPAGQRHFGEILGAVLLVVLGQLFTCLLFRLLDGQEQVALVAVQLFEIDAYMVIARGILQVDDMRNHRAVAAIAGPAMLLILQFGAGKAGRSANRGGQIGSHLQVQHFLDKYAKDDIEGFLFLRLRPGGSAHAGPLAPFIVIDALGVDLMGAVERVLALRQRV